MPSLEEEERAVFDDVEDDDDDDSQDVSDSDDEEDDDDGFAQVNDPAPPAPAAEADLNSASVNPNPDASLGANPSDPSLLAAQNGGPIGAMVVSPAPVSAAPVSAEEEEVRQQRALEERQRAFEESRRLFQRLWTDEDELVILQGFYEFVSGRGTVHASHQHDTGPFYEQIRSSLQLDFTKNQLIEKLRRLKKKFRNVVARMTSAGSGEFAFKSAHEKATFEIARKIWSSHLKRGRDFMDDDDLLGLPIVDSPDSALAIDARPRRRGRKRFASASAVTVAAVTPACVPAADHSADAAPVPTTNHVSASSAAGAWQQPLNPSVIEETVRSCLSPFFKELLNSALNGPCRPALGDAGLGLNWMPLSLGSGNVKSTGAVDDEKWRKQQIMELEVYAKRIELVQDQIKSTLEELRSMGN